MTRGCAFVLLWTSLADAQLTKDALRWFPARTETVLATREGFDLLPETFKAEAVEEILASFTVLQASIPFLLDILYVPKEESRLKFTGMRVVSAVLGATSLGREHSGWDGIPLGIGFYKGCLVLEFEKELPLAITEMPYRMTMRQAGRPSKSRAMLIHKQFIKLRDRLLLACNDEAYFEETLRGYHFPASQSEFEQSEVWKHLRIDSRLWGIRKNAEMEMLFQHLARSNTFQINESRPAFSTRTISANPSEDGIGNIWELMMKLGFELSI